MSSNLVSSLSTIWNKPVTQLTMSNNRSLKLFEIEFAQYKCFSLFLFTKKSILCVLIYTTAKYMADSEEVLFPQRPIGGVQTPTLQADGETYYTTTYTNNNN